LSGAGLGSRNRTRWPMLTLEQAELASVQPASSGQRQRTDWRGLGRSARPLLAVLAAVSALSLELGALTLWLRGELASWGGAWRLLLMAAMPFLAIVLSLAVHVLAALIGYRPGKTVKRTLRLDDLGLKLSHTRYDRVAWADVRRWFLAPVEGAKGMVLLTLERGWRRGGGRAYWSIVLDGHDQRQSLLSEFDYLRQTGRTNAPVLELSGPIPTPAIGLKGLWAIMLALMLFVPGMGLWMAGLGSADAKAPAAPSTPAESQQAERVARWVVSHLLIKNERQWRRLLWGTGSTLTASAVGLVIWGTRRQNREKRKNQRQFELDLARLTVAHTPPDTFRPEMPG